MMGYISLAVSSSAISDSMVNYGIINLKSMILMIMLFYKLLLAQSFPLVIHDFFDKQSSLPD